MFIRHTPFIKPNTFSKKWAVPYNRISMSNWSTFRYKFVWINLHLLYRPRHPCLLFGTIHWASCDPCLIFRTPLLIGTQEYHDLHCRSSQCDSGVQFGTGSLRQRWQYPTHATLGIQESVRNVSIGFCFQGTFGAKSNLILPIWHLAQSQGSSLLSNGNYRTSTVGKLSTTINPFTVVQW